MHPSRDVELWRLELGLYPVPLFAEGEESNQFILLNGNRGNFCLDLTSQLLGADARNSAWSANVGHYVGLLDGYVEVQRWDKRRQAIERYDYDKVFADLEKFHLHLERDEPRRELSVVSHVIRIFRSLRATVGRAADGGTSLKAFLYLLASVTEDLNTAPLTLERWGLDHTAVEAADLISENDWIALKDDLIGGRPLEGLRPNPTLILRHASGQLFQEAHYEAVAINQEQLRLSGFLPPPIAPAKNTKEFGLHFTPPALARTLVEEAIECIDELPPVLVVFDPACGSGEFLREILRQLKIRNYQGRIKLEGWDISEAACDMARFVLAWEQRGYETQVEVNIVRQDSVLTQNWPKNVTIVVMNPPFVSWLDMKPDQRNAITTALGSLSRNRPDLSSVFVVKAASTLAQQGVLATILPASFLDGESADPIRKQLADSIDTRLVARLGSHQLFLSATVDAALYVGQVDGIGEGPLALWADHRPRSASAALRALRKVRSNRGATALPILEQGFNIYRGLQIGRGSKSWAPRPYDAWKLLRSLDLFPKVTVFFDVKQGIRTGLNKAFILKKENWEKLPKGERSYFRPAVVNESIQDGVLTDVAYLFYPYGEQHIATESALKARLEKYYRSFLLPHKELLAKRASLRAAKWWELSEHRTWQEESEAKLVSTYFGDAGSFAWDSGVYVVVQGFAWIWRATPRFRQLPTTMGLAYLTILNSNVFSKLLSGTSNHVGGGQWNLSKRYVSHIPLPNLLDETLDRNIINELSRIGAHIHAGKMIEVAEREEVVSAVYGLDDSL